jgi:uncharacterized protein YybS (DUF2232 family)
VSFRQSRQGRAADLLVGGGMGLALAAFAGGEARGVLGGVTSLVSLLPVGLALVFRGLGAAAVASVVAVLAGALVVDTTLGAVVALRYGFPGVVLGVALARRLSLPLTLILVTGASLAGLLLLLAVYLPPGVGFGRFLERQLDSHVQGLEALPGRFGMPADPAWVAESAQLAAAIMKKAGPAIVLAGLLVTALVNYLLARLCLRGQGFRSFAEESVPDHLVWGVIVGGTLLALGRDALWGVGLNVLVALMPLYAIQGLAVLRHLFQKARLPRPLQGVGFVLFALQPLLLVPVACLGLFDLWVDFRKIRRAATPA